MVDEELHFKTILRRKNAAKARIYRKSVIDDKKSKRLKTALKENGTFDKRRGNDSTTLRIPLSELSPNILNDGRGITNVEVSRQLHSSLKTKPSTNNNIRSKRISSRNITKLGVNLSKRFDNTFAATTSNQDPIPELQLNELFASDSGDDNMNDESDGYSSATNSSFDEDEMSNGTDAMETFEITSGGYYDIGDPVIECQYCGANMWYSERKNKCLHASNPKFSMCCGSGKVQLPLLKPAPKVLQHLLFDNESYMYTIEFQKRGLPHAHILIFLHPSNKYPTPSDIDRIISAEIPDQDTNEELYNLVKTHMIHGPCGFANRSSPCMKDGKCSKYFPKQFQPETIVDQDGFPVYRRRDNGHTVLKNGIQVDNRNVVPYNAKLLTKYQAHINMEWCNQSTSIKYLFKYINKGYDRITAAIVPNDDGTSNQPQNIDEIKQYIDCRYVSPSEASWRIFSFPIHGRKPAVERLYFHCEGQNLVYYTDFDRINTVLEKPSVTESMFTSWFEANCKYPEAQNLTYSKFVSKFVYVKKKREWKPRQKGYTIGRLIWVPPTTGELYYLRLMLTHVKGPHSYNDIKTVNNVKYDTFRDACFAMGFIGDDREFIAAIKEANHWGSGQYLRLLFVHMLLSGSINRSRHVWSKTCHLLVDGILYAQQRIANNRGIIFPIL
ncbi:hypothetical protein KIW84_045778 [Lathyrus oleraceus]|uniref:Helitron helicase-like domain-containing protein n=1 Tax=Pisum sativum TaxID=3888 RepID=A0A9D4XPM6_PEA|nr:hypothetical protein KIW84_045778 [Pisum sativum]